jgi:SAM-dependent methyltransferase
VRSVVRGQEGQVPETAWRHAAENLSALTIVVAGVERLADREPFLADVRRQAAAIDAAVDVVAIETAPDGIGATLRRAFSEADGQFIITVDPDIAPPLTFIQDLWAHRNDGEVVIASRYVDGSDVRMSSSRRALSHLLNKTFQRALSFGVRDVTSALRLYHRRVLEDMPGLKARPTGEASGYDVLPEILVRAYAAGWRVVEIPLKYAPNPGVPGKAHRKLTTAYVKTSYALWKLRNSIAAADYDYRAHDSVIPLQRYWQRTRFRHITSLIAGQGPVLDAGCGSSHIIGALPNGSVALDILANKLRFARRFDIPLVRGSIFTLPFADATFPCVLSSQVIEHIPMAPSPIDELCRVLKPGGRLVLGTPDYDRLEWVYIEKAYGFFAPGGYADEHISHYTRQSLLADFARRGYTHEATRYVCRGELILAFRKPAA